MLHRLANFCGDFLYSSLLDIISGVLIKIFNMEQPLVLVNVMVSH